MEPYSRSTSPPGQPPLFFARMVDELQRDAIYRARAPWFRGALSDDQYFRKCRLMDSKPVAVASKTLWTLSTVNSADADVLASVEVHVRDILYRATPDSPTIKRKAANLSSLFVSMQHRGHGFARQLLHRVVASLRSRHLSAPLNNIALVYATCAPNAEPVCASMQNKRC